MNSKSAKSIGFLVAVMMLGGVGVAHAALTESQISSILSLLSSFGADQSVVDNVDASLRGTAPSGTTTGGSGAAVCPFAWSRSLTTGDTGDDVMALQKFLNASSDTRVAASGVGSAGNETNYFGSLTAAAVAKFQNTHSSEVLAPLGLNAGTGYFGASSRAKANELCVAGGTTTPDPGTGTTVPAGTGLSVSSATQPVSTLAPDSASRVPFTNFTVTAGSDGPVTINTVTVERQGLGANAVFSGITLVDETGVQYGLAKTLNSNNQANIGGTVTIPAGTSKTFTVAGNMASNNATRDGQYVRLAVLGINTSATVSGSLPIVGATHTINATLAIGTVNAQTGALDPRTSPSKEVGTTNYTFAAVKFTAGSEEDVTMKSIRWNQSSSVSADDIANVKIIVDQVEYPAVVSEDGKYYSATFGSGIVIKEGLQKEVSIMGDIVGGSNRGVDFDLYQDTDVHIVGNTFGYGITPSIGGDNDTNTSSDDSEFNDGSGDGGAPPFYDGREVTVGTGSLTISSTNDIPAGNIAEGQSNVPLGSFKFDVNGEEVSFTQIVLTIATSSGSGTDGDITNVTLVDANGSTIAGPQDLSVSAGTVTISDTITLPVGTNIIRVYGTLDNDWENNDTIVVSLQTAASALTSIRGAVSGQTITATPASTVTAKTQTVNGASLTVTPDSSLVAQNIINNSNDAILGRYVLDASSSGEDIRITTMQFENVTGANADVDELNTLTVYENGVALNTGSNVLNPSGNAGGADKAHTITIDSPGLTILKGKTKVIELRGNVAASSTPNSATTYTVDFADSTLTSDWTVTGLSTGTSVIETLATAAGATMTVVDSGTLTVSLDSADPVEKWYVAGSVAEIARIQFAGVNEALALTDFSLLLDTASSSSADISEVSLWDGLTKLLSKTAPFQTANTEAFDLPSAGTGSFIVGKDTYKELTVKVKFAQIGTSLAGASGKRVRVATTTTATDRKSLGKDSGTSANVLGSMGTSTGAKYFRSLPTVAKLAVDNRTLANTTMELYRFSITADPAGDVAIFKTSFTVSTTSANADSFTLTENETGKNVGGTVQSAQGVVEMPVANANYGSTFITIPAGETRTYVLKAILTNGGTAGDSVQVKLNGDGLAVLLAGQYMDDTTAVDGQAEDDFIWSPISDGSVLIADEDWINGYKVPGIETDNLGTEVISN
ncbi:MAG: hypothetical protein WD003_02685 [Candidatus Paceibacterota bacterium]